MKVLRTCRGTKAPWWLATLLSAFSGMASLAHGAELSLVSGVYKSQSYKFNDADGGSKTEIGLGARYSQPIEGRLFWLVQGSLDLRTYGRGAAPEAPSNSTNLTAGGGVRYYFNKLTDHIEPYVLALGRFVSDKDATPGPTGYTEKSTNGLYYSGDFGIRISLQKEFFVDFELPLFESALFGTEKTTTKVYGTPTATSSETSRNELFGQDYALLTGVNVIVGMRF